jgi:chromosomal replication initiation ATPase DnaA
MKEIVTTICTYYNIEEKQIFKNTRSQKSVYYRHLFFYLCRHFFPNRPMWFYSDFIEKNGGVNYNHATIINALKVIENRKQYELKVRTEVDELILRINIYPPIVIADFNLLECCSKVVEPKILGYV